eukprot:2861141-Pleurochrysis_carterae.AAC.6
MWHHQPVVAKASELGPIHKPSIQTRRRPSHSLKPLRRPVLSYLRHAERCDCAGCSNSSP